MNKYWLLLLVAGISTAASASATEINVVATTSGGESVSPEIHLYQAGSNRDVWPRRQGNTAGGVPPGYYRVEVSFKGYRRFSRDLAVSGQHIDVRVLLTPSMEATGELVLTGTVAHARDVTGLWALAFPLEGQPSDFVESLVNAAGEFRLATPHGGDYMITVVKGSKVLGCQHVSIGVTNEPIVIDVHETK